MKSTVALLALLGAAASCAAAKPCIDKSQFKGAELYSWHVAGDQWKFALVPGTNRQKSEQEVKSGAACIHTLAQVRQILAQLGEKDEVFWIERRSMRFVLPPPDKVAALAASAAGSGARLHVVRDPSHETR